MSKRKLGIAVAILLCTAITFAFTKKKKPAGTRPNILLIVSEDHCAHLSCYGDKVIQTPNLDNIAKNGIMFKNAYVSESVCSPSRSTILSGLYPHQTGHFGLATYGFHYAMPVQTVYALLKKAGYRTGMIGKLHVLPESEFPIDYRPISSPNYEKKGLSRYAIDADEFFKAGDAPFFLMVNFPDTHWPFQDDVEGRPKKKVDTTKVVPFDYLAFDNPRIRKYCSSLYNCMLRLDECVGELMDKLHNSGKEKETLVFFLSDHGDEMARGKFDNYEASTKIPFMISWKGKIVEGKKSDALVSTIDIMPTILGLAGVAKPERATGKSLVPLFKNPDFNFRQYLFTEKNIDQPDMFYPRRAVRDGRYKLNYSLMDGEDPVAALYMRNGTRAEALGGSPTRNEVVASSSAVTKKIYADWLKPAKTQLYDLQNDPWEFNDLSADPKYAAIKKRLIEHVTKWQQDTDDPLRFPEKLKMLKQESDSVEKLKPSEKTVWRYPQYLYGQKL